MQTGDDSTQVCLSGELDVATAGNLDAVLHALLAKGQALVLDLSGLTFADCSGLRPIQDAQRRHPGRVTLLGSRGIVRRVLVLTGLASPG